MSHQTLFPNNWKLAVVTLLRSPQSGFSNVFSNHSPEQMKSHIGCICLFLSRVSPQMVREGKFQVTLVLFVWSFRGFQMSPQTTCFSTCMVALVSSGQFFSRGSFKVYPKMTRIRRCVVTLVAFVWFSPWMNYQMRSQTTCIRGCKITLVAFVRFFSGVYFQMYPQFTCIDSWTVTLVAFVFFFSGMSFEVSP